MANCPSKRGQSTSSELFHFPLKMYRKCGKKILKGKGFVVSLMWKFCNHVVRTGLSSAHSRQADCGLSKEEEMGIT